MGQIANRFTFRTVCEVEAVETEPGFYVIELSGDEMDQCAAHAAIATHYVSAEGKSMVRFVTTPQPVFAMQEIPEEDARFIEAEEGEEGH